MFITLHAAGHTETTEVKDWDHEELSSAVVDDIYCIFRYSGGDLVVV